MGAMWRRLILQRLKVQLQGLAPHAVSSLVQPSKTIEQGLKQGLKEGASGSIAAALGINRLSGLRSMSSEGLRQPAASKGLSRPLQGSEKVSSRGLRVPPFDAKRKVADVIQQSLDAAKSGSPTQGLHCLLKKLSRGTTTAESVLQRSSVLSLKPPSNSALTPLLGFPANPSLTLLQPHAFQKLHHKASLQSPLSFTKHPFKATNRVFSTKGRPSDPKSDARRRLAEESVRKASAKSKNMLLYLFALTIAMVGATYSAVPLYRMFCQATGFGGTVQKKETVEEKIARHTTEKKAAPARQITVQFNADVADGMPWKFTPCQREVKVVPGQSTLAFYTAHNLSDKAITGVSTYNVSPMRAGIYFNKIQCFCFEEQRLRPGEKVDMPVFFYIDPEFAEDVKMKGINLLTLSYTFFKVEEDE